MLTFCTQNKKSYELWNPLPVELTSMKALLDDYWSHNPDYERMFVTSSRNFRASVIGSGWLPMKF